MADELKRHNKKIHGHGKNKKRHNIDASIKPG